MKQDLAHADLNDEAREEAEDGETNAPVTKADIAAKYMTIAVYITCKNPNSIF